MHTIDSIELNAEFNFLFNETYKNVVFSNNHQKNVFFGDGGKETYRLLSYFSTLYNHSSILHIGDSLLSATALSYNATNQVLWFDFQNQHPPSGCLPKNVSFTAENIFDDETQKIYLQEILKTKFVYVSVSPHVGTIEYILCDWLKNNQYEGFIIFDEIWVHKEMRNECWYKIPYENRFDLTHVGNKLGTGVVSFGNGGGFHKNNNDNWTMVTGYFNLTKCPDASDEIKKRNDKYYFSHAVSTMSLPYHLVVYCDKESFTEIEKMRPFYLKNKTSYIIKEFDELQFKKQEGVLKDTFADYRNKIIQNRKTHPYHFDPRNTASYYLFCMSRYLILKEVIETNPFQSTHFAWINFCIERMGYNNLIKLDEALAVKRDKFSTCYIDYQPKELVENTKEYFQWGRCSMCSGFFTGNAKYMFLFCDLLENKFLHYLKEGWGHSDETIFTAVYFDNPDIFEHYYGDYTEMITNYKYIHERATEPLHNFIKNSFTCKNYEKCFEACQFVFHSHCLQKCFIGDEYLKLLYYYYMNCKRMLKHFP